MEYSSIIKEARQRGTLYHFCTIYDVAKYIIPEDKLSPSGNFKNKITGTRDTVSLTREQKLKLNTLRSFDVGVRIAIDGNSLSNNKKIKPYSDNRSAHVEYSYNDRKNLDYSVDEAEEFVVGEIKDFHKYILEILIYIKTPDLDFFDIMCNTRDYEDMVESFRELVKYVVKYNIPKKKVIIQDFEDKSYNLQELMKYNTFVKSSDYFSFDKVYENIKKGDLSFLKYYYEYGDENGDNFEESIYNVLYEIVDDNKDKLFELIKYIVKYKSELNIREREKVLPLLFEVNENLSAPIEEDELKDYFKENNF